MQRLVGDLGGTCQGNDIKNAPARGIRGRAIGLTRKGWIFRSLGLDLECGRKLCHGGEQRRFSDVRCLGLDIKRRDEPWACIAARGEMSGISDALDWTFSDPPRAASSTHG